MFKAILVVVTMLAMGGQADASEKWSAIGILTTQVKGEEAHARYVEIDDFETLEMCRQVVGRESHSDDYIGQGGTRTGKCHRGNGITMPTAYKNAIN